MEETLYLFKNEFEIQAYNGEALSLTVDGVVIKTFFNPTREILSWFGYKPLKNTVRPEDEPGFVIERYYENDTDYIKECWRYVPQEEPESN